MRSKSEIQLDIVAATAAHEAAGERLDALRDEYLLAAGSVVATGLSSTWNLEVVDLAKRALGDQAADDMGRGKPTGEATAVIGGKIFWIQVEDAADSEDEEDEGEDD